MDEHAPLFMIAAVMILAGIQLIGVGLLGELQVRHFFTQSQKRRMRWTGLCGYGHRKRA